MRVALTKKWKITSRFAEFISSLGMCVCYAVDDERAKHKDARCKFLLQKSFGNHAVAHSVMDHSPAIICMVFDHINHTNNMSFTP